MVDEAFLYINKIIYIHFMVIIQLAVCCQGYLHCESEQKNITPFEDFPFTADLPGVSLTDLRCFR